MTPNQQNKQQQSKARTQQIARKSRMVVSQTLFRDQRVPRGFLGDFKLFNPHDPFPPACDVLLDYQITESLFTGAASFKYGAIGFTYNLNGAFQPTTGATHKPYGWAQMIALYGRYKVDRVRIQFEFTTAQGSDDIYCSAMLLNANTTATLAGSTVSIMAEKPMVATKHLTQTGSQKVVITLECNIWDIEGIPKAAYEADVVGGNYAALVTANPSQIPTAFCAVAGGLAAGGTVVTLKTSITYHVKFWDRILEAQS